MELHDLQTVISKLDDPSSPSQVAECLTLRREVMFLKHELVMRHYLKNTFLASGNMPAFYTLNMCTSAALDKLCDTPKLVCYSTIIITVCLYSVTGQISSILKYYFLYLFLLWMTRQQNFFLGEPFWHS